MEMWSGGYRKASSDLHCVPPTPPEDSDCTDHASGTTSYVPDGRADG